MSRRMKFHNQSDLTQAYAGLSGQTWVDSCTVDVPRLELRVHLVDGSAMARRAEAWLQRQPWWRPGPAADADRS
ncbi:MAG: hypothetical protein HKP30_05810 [Myxococcales bacterium]|nr:hypothetical protein [Myxococcales bacterium]